jgi:hypothetical protein
MTSRLTSDMTPDQPAAAPAPSPEAKTDTPSDRPKSETPHVASPPTSPWWTAPAGKPVDIPAFGRTLSAFGRCWIETLLAWLAPAPQPIPLRIRIRARR